MWGIIQLRELPTYIGIHSFEFAVRIFWIGK